MSPFAARTWLFVLLCFGVAHTYTANTRPVIGVLTLPCDSPYCGSAIGYVPASYVKYLESGGGRVVPIPWESSQEQLKSLLDSLNGVLFTGGSASFADQSPFFASVKYIYDYVVAANENGDYFPLWGICLGFEGICRAQSQNASVLSSVSAENLTLPLDLSPLAISSRVFGGQNPGAAFAMNILSSQNVTFNNHVFGVTPADFVANPPLSTFFNILSTNFDINGIQFVSLIESKLYPIWGSQFHPEKNPFEWDLNEVIQHTRDAVFASTYLAAFFVEQTRRSAHSFASTAELHDALIYNYQPKFTDSEFTQVYLFGK